LLENIGIGLALFAIAPFFIILDGDLLRPAQGDRLRSRRGGALRSMLAIFWIAVLIGAFGLSIWFKLGARLEDLAGVVAQVVPPFAAVYALRFLGPRLTRTVMRLSGV
jgi:drug/metabolite transporter (DMT)-like permease